MVAGRERPFFQNLWIRAGMSVSTLLNFFALLFLSRSNAHHFALVQFGKRMCHFSRH